jgi:hypothetical protein
VVSTCPAAQNTKKARQLRRKPYVEMITGKVCEIDQSNWKNDGPHIRFEKLPVWDSPVMIAERSLVELKGT